MKSQLLIIQQNEPTELLTSGKLHPDLWNIYFIQIQDDTPFRKILAEISKIVLKNYKAFIFNPRIFLVLNSNRFKENFDELFSEMRKLSSLKIVLSKKHTYIFNFEFLHYILVSAKIKNMNCIFEETQDYKSIFMRYNEWICIQHNFEHVDYD